MTAGVVSFLITNKGSEPGFRSMGRLSVADPCASHLMAPETPVFAFYGTMNDGKDWTGQGDCGGSEGK